MTSFDHIWVSASPEYREQLRRANEARAAAYYAAWRALVRAVGNGFDRFAAALERRRRQRRTYHELSALSDRQLDDIGLRRAEIPFLARKVAAESARAEVTLADLPRIRSAPSGGALPEAPRPGEARRHGPRPWAARPARERTGRAA